MILIVGTGRSGTSAVSEILHKTLGVDMGRSFHMPDEFNPKGYFEDKEFQAINQNFAMMGLDQRDQDHEAWGHWKEAWNKLLESKKEPWGVKDPGIADMPELLNEYMKLKPHVIWCVRDKEDTIKSFVKFKGKSRKEMEEIYDRRMKNLTEALRGYPHLIVQCVQHPADKEKQVETWYNKTIKSNNI